MRWSLKPLPDSQHNRADRHARRFLYFCESSSVSFSLSLFLPWPWTFLFFLSLQLIYLHLSSLPKVRWPSLLFDVLLTWCDQSPLSAKERRMCVSAWLWIVNSFISSCGENDRNKKEEIRSYTRRIKREVFLFLLFLLSFPHFLPTSFPLSFPLQWWNSVKNDLQS